jgi:hypothetical protein
VERQPRQRPLDGCHPPQKGKESQTLAPVMQLGVPGAPMPRERERDAFASKLGGLPVGAAA